MAIMHNKYPIEKLYYTDLKKENSWNMESKDALLEQRTVLILTLNGNSRNEDNISNVCCNCFK